MLQSFQVYKVHLKIFNYYTASNILVLWVGGQTSEAEFVQSGGKDELK